MNIWIEKLRAAPTKIERDEILLREWKQSVEYRFSDAQRLRFHDEVEDQLRALADLAFNSSTVL